MSINAGTAIGYLDLDTSKFGNALKTAQKQLSSFSKDSLSAGQKFTSVGQGLKTVGSTLSKAVTVPLLAAGIASTKTAVDFESAFAGVKKTVDATDAELAKLEKGIRSMAKEMPTAATEIAGVAEAAGQLGIKTPNILDFTKTMVMLGDSTNMSAEEAATSLARLANITGMSQTDFDKLGSTIVALGNNLATTESEITEIGLRLAGAGKQVGMTEAQVLGFAGALSSVGLNSEVAGSSFSKVMISMQLATETGGEKLQQFASVAGMSASEFKRAFKEDAASAMIAFIKGLGDAESQGKSAVGILEDMEIREVGLRDSLLRAAGASDVFSEALEIGTQAWDENTALTNEANQRYETVASKMAMLKNKLVDIGITIGNALMPFVESLVTKIGELADWFSNLDGTTQGVILTIAGVVAAIGPMLIIIGQMSIGVGAVIDGFKLLKGAFGVVKGFITSNLIPAISNLWGFLMANPIVLVIGAIALLVGGFIYLRNNCEDFREFWINLWDTVVEWTSNAVDGIVAWFEELASNISQAWDNIVTSIGNACDSIVTWFEELPSKIAQVWENIKTSIGNACDSVGNFFTQTIPKWIEGIVNWFNELPYKIGYALGVMLGNIVLWGIETWNYFATNVPKWIESISTWFSELPGKIWNWLLGCIEKIIQWGTDTYNKAKDWTSKTMQSVTDFFSQLPGNIWNWLTQAIQKVAQWGSDTYNKAKDWTTKTINNVGQWFSQLPGKIWQWLVQAIQKVSQWGSDMARKGMDAARSTVNNVIDGFKSLPGKVLNVGKEAVRSLWNGISSMGGWIKNQISGFISGIVAGFGSVKGKISSALGKARTIQAQCEVEYIDAAPQLQDNYSQVRFNYAQANEASLSDSIARSSIASDALNKLESSLKRNFSAGNTDNNFENTYNINLNIDKMMNSDNRSIEDIADQLAFYLRRKNIAIGGVR